jgi:hypothetical protein
MLAAWRYLGFQNRLPILENKGVTHHESPPISGSEVGFVQPFRGA